MKILDIDLDFFLNRRAEDIAVDSSRRLSNKDYIPWRPESVEEFLENTLKLRVGSPIHGKFFIRHSEVYHEIKKLREAKAITCPLEIYHVDAHADLGMGDSSWSYIMVELLSKSLSERSVVKAGGGSGLNSGNYLLFMIANRWISKLNFIIGKAWREDIPPSILNNTDLIDKMRFDKYSLTIQLKRYSPDSINDIHRKDVQPIGYEPEIPLEIIPYSGLILNDNDKFDYMFLAQSLGYTPESSDVLIPLIREYIEEY